jgi:hypothetical protein
MREALRNLEQSFVGNPLGAGSPRKEIIRRMKYNKDHQQAGYRAMGDAWADMFMERRRRIHEYPVLGWTPARDKPPVRHVEKRSAHANAGASDARSTEQDLVT